MRARENRQQAGQGKTNDGWSWKGGNVILETFLLGMKVHRENNKPWVFIHKNNWLDKIAKVVEIN
ncbi:hypothetical protein A7K69_08235 [Parageobacillus thermoglucosidasius]|jgi:hypothetical protein|uniref:Uncharacterized protein n=1 Tax=Parageobacillus thermoglucosidasius TaxID=1426 RepID=A0A1B7KS70_PARTM|nr:hypothetical protein A7K69_08235 [Parageobacillus thermoglucosidasius]